MSTKHAEQLERDQRAFELHMAGSSYAQIARALGFASKSSAHAAVQRALDSRDTATSRKIGDRYARELRTDLARLDTLLQAHWAAARRGDAVATDRVLKITERRLALLALIDAATSDGPAEIGEDDTDPEVVSIASIRAQRAARLAESEDAAST